MRLLIRWDKCRAKPLLSDGDIGAEELGRVSRCKLALSVLQLDGDRDHTQNGPIVDRVGPRFWNARCASRKGENRSGNSRVPDNDSKP